MSGIQRQINRATGISGAGGRMTASRRVQSSHAGESVQHVSKAAAVMRAENERSVRNGRQARKAESKS